MLLYAIFPLDKSLIYQPMSIKIERGSSAVLAFRSELAARAYIDDSLASGNFAVEELTVERFDLASKNARAHLGSDTYIKVMD